MRTALWPTLTAVSYTHLDVYKRQVTASLVSGIEPVLNPILVAVFYGENMGPMAVVGAAIVIGGVVIYNVCRAKQPKSNLLHTN